MITLQVGDVSNWLITKKVEDRVLKFLGTKHPKLQKRIEYRIVFYTKNGREVKDHGGAIVDFDDYKVPSPKASSSVLEVSLLRGADVINDFASLLNGVRRINSQMTFRLMTWHIMISKNVVMQKQKK